MDTQATSALEQSTDNHQPSPDSKNPDSQNQLTLEQKIRLIQALLDLNAEPQRHSRTTILGQTSASLNSFSLFPSASVHELLNEAGVHATAEEALAADWRRVGRDMWSGFLTELGQHRSTSTR